MEDCASFGLTACSVDGRQRGTSSVEKNDNDTPESSTIPHVVPRELWWREASSDPMDCVDKRSVLSFEADCPSVAPSDGFVRLR